MAIQFEHTIEVPQPPQKVFAVLDDLSQTPKWLSRCTGIEKLTAGENAVGTKLKYSYRECGRAGTMDGEIVDRAVSHRLSFRYEDKMMRVGVRFSMQPKGAGTHLTHSIDITPKKFLAKLFSFMIRKQLPKQTVEAMEKLRELLASS